MADNKMTGFVPDIKLIQEFTGRSWEATRVKRVYGIPRTLPSFSFG